MPAMICAIPLLLLSAVLGAEPAREPSLIVKPEAFRTLVNPPCSHCRDEAKRRADQLRSDDRVLCWVRGKYDGGAIPLRFFLNPYRVISDTYGVFVYDPDAGYTRGFAPSLDFAFHGWRNGVMVMKHKDGTLYSCLTGVAFAGPGTGKRLPLIPTVVSDWGFWLDRYPGTVAYHMFDKYQPTELPTRPQKDSLKSRGPTDPRLPAEEPVLGMAVGKQARAYPLAALMKAGLIRDRIAGKDCIALWYAPTRTAAAYEPIARPPKGSDQPKPLTFAVDPKNVLAPFLDKETGTHWDCAGRGAEGPLRGWTLTWLDGTQVKWYAWAAEYPETTIHR